MEDFYNIVTHRVYWDQRWYINTFFKY
jgi:hypothetical protein